MKRFTFHLLLLDRLLLITPQKTETKAVFFQQKKERKKEVCYAFPVERAVCVCVCVCVCLERRQHFKVLFVFRSLCNSEAASTLATLCVYMCVSFKYKDASLIYYSDIMQLYYLCTPIHQYISRTHHYSTTGDSADASFSAYHRVQQNQMELLSALIG